MRIGFIDVVNVPIYLILFLLSLTSTAICNESSSKKDEVELRIDFSSGSVIANESPKVIAPLKDLSVFLGTTDTIIAMLTEVFHDAENGSALQFSAKSLDSSLVRGRINPVDSTLKISFSPERIEGRSAIILTASDGSKEVSDTFSVVIKKLFILNDTLADTTVKSGDKPIVIKKDISSILPILLPNSIEKYHFTVSSSDKS